MKKLILAMLLIVAVVVALAACESNEGNASDTTVADTTAEATTVEDTTPVETTAASEESATAEVTTAADETTEAEVTTVEETTEEVTTEEVTTEEVTTEEVTTEEVTTAPEIEITELGTATASTGAEPVENPEYGYDGDASTVFVSPTGITTNYIFSFDEEVYITKVVIDRVECYGTLLPFITSSDDLGNPAVYTGYPGISAVGSGELVWEVNAPAKHLFLGFVCQGNEFFSFSELHVYTNEAE